MRRSHSFIRVAYCATLPWSWYIEIAAARQRPAPGAKYTKTRPLRSTSNCRYVSERFDPVDQETFDIEQELLSQSGSVVKPDFPSN